jgi:hypothetical protein
MKHLFFVSLISLAATPFGLAQTPAAADNKTAEQEVKQMIEQYRTALTRRIPRRSNGFGRTITPSSTPAARLLPRRSAWPI